MTNTVIVAENVGKKYLIGHKTEKVPYLAMRDVAMQGLRRFWTKTRGAVTGRPIISGDILEEVWALKDLTFDIRQGEAVGIIGRNGAGKSTLLKILSRITEPTTGRVIIKGRVASLLEVGTGFHPELSGRENIYLNGTILGMTRGEIRRKFDEIVAFAEVEKYLDTPVKRYSSGMYVRLAFAVAAHLEPEILVVDEVLAVGDAAFQKKCLGKMEDVTQKGRTVLFVSHNMAAIQTLCSQAIYLDSGKMVSMGEVNDQIGMYLDKLREIKRTNSSGLIDLGQSVQIKSLDFQPNPMMSGGGCRFSIELQSKCPVKISDFCIIFNSSLNARVAVIDLRSSENYALSEREPVIFKGNITSIPFVEGSYSIGLYYKLNGVADHVMDILDIDILAKSENRSFTSYPPSARGLVQLDANFEVLKNNVD